MILSGEMVSTHQALQCGLVDEVVSDAELMMQAMRLGKRMAAKSRVGMKMILETVKEGVQRPLAEALQIENRALGSVCRGRDAREGVTAFIEKRQAHFLDE